MIDSILTTDEYARDLTTLRKTLEGCIEHMEWSTPQGKAARDEAKRLVDQYTPWEEYVANHWSRRFSNKQEKT